jgi:hypothetical protein
MSKNGKTQDQTPNNPSSQQPQRTQIQPNRKNTHTTDQLQKNTPSLINTEFLTNQ